MRRVPEHVVRSRNVKKNKRRKGENAKYVGHIQTGVRGGICVQSISEFILHDDNKFVFEFDSNADKVTNISNCANALRKSYCAMLKDGEINEKVFVKKMTLIYQRIAAMIKGEKSVRRFDNKIRYHIVFR